jgi:hypothetical protein
VYYNIGILILRYGNKRATISISMWVSDYTGVPCIHNIQKNNNVAIPIIVRVM